MSRASSSSSMAEAGAGRFARIESRTHRHTPAGPDSVSGSAVAVAQPPRQNGFLLVRGGLPLSSVALLSLELLLRPRIAVAIPVTEKTIEAKRRERRARRPWLLPHGDVKRHVRRGRAARVDHQPALCGLVAERGGQIVRARRYLGEEERPLRGRRDELRALRILELHIHFRKERAARSGEGRP